MSRILKAVLLPVLLIVVLALFSFYGCGDVETTTGGATTTGVADEISLTQPRLKQILADSLTNHETLNTYKFNIDMDALMTVTGGPTPGEITTNYQISGGTNVASKQTQMNINITASGMPSGGAGPKSGSYEMYALEDYLYTKITAAGMSEQWIKMPATEEYTGSLNLDEVHAQMGPLESPVKIEFLRLERVDGLDCYMLSVTPNMTALGQWLTEEQGPNEGFSWEEMVKLSEIFKKIEYTCYVTRDSNYLKRISSSIVMEYTSEQAGVAAGEFDKMMMEIRADMNLYDYDMPFSVTLPDEAASATEVSGDTASN